MTALSMTMPLVLTGIVGKATLLLAFGWCGALLFRRQPAVARHLIWLTAIAGALVIPLLARVAPVNVPLLPSVSATAPTPTLRDAEGLVRPPTTLVVSRGVRATSVSATRYGWLPHYDTLAVTLWIAGTVGLLASFLAGMLSVRRIIRRGTTLHAAEWTRALANGVERLGLASSPRLIMSDQVEMAFAFGVLTPTIILPASAEEWSDDRRRAVLLHELAHIRRRDLVGHTIAGVACAVYWFNPFVWAAARRLRVESELASDDVVLEHGIRPSDYAQHLLDMVTSFSHRTPTVALAMARPKEFEGRLVAILDRTNRRGVFKKTQGGAAVGLLGLLTVSIAAVVPVPRAGETAPVGMTVPAARRPSLTLHDSRARYSVPAMTAAAAEPPRRTVAALSQTTIAALLQRGTSGIINPMVLILQNADSLGLDGRQADSIATLNRRYMMRLSELWSPVSSFYRSHPQTGDESSVNTSFRRAPQESMGELIAIVPNIMRLLTPEQRLKLPPRITRYLDTQTLAAIGSGEMSVAGGIFLPDGGIYGGPGRRMGGPGR
jgi:beta-lactamase regulating signal transducer with metallopeptidase domain